MSIISTVVGNIGGQPEVRAAGSSQVLSFRLASNSRQKVDGNWTDQTTWVSVSMFGERAEKLAQYLKKGSKVVVSGQMHLRQYQANGETRTSLELRADHLEFAGDAKGASNGAGKHTEETTTETQSDDIPF